MHGDFHFNQTKNAKQIAVEIDEKNKTKKTNEFFSLKLILSTKRCSQFLYFPSLHLTGE